MICMNKKIEENRDWIAFIFLAFSLLISIFTMSKTEIQGNETNQRIDNLSRQIENLSVLLNENVANTRNISMITYVSKEILQEGFSCDRYDSLVADYEILLRCQVKDCTDKSNNSTLTENLKLFELSKRESINLNCSLALEYLTDISESDNSQCGYDCSWRTPQTSVGRGGSSVDLYGTNSFIPVLIVILLIVIGVIAFFLLKKRN